MDKGEIVSVAVLSCQVFSGATSSSFNTAVNLFFVPMKLLPSPGLRLSPKLTKRLSVFREESDVMALIVSKWYHTIRKTYENQV